ncbi:MAG: phytoene/squalene synthase family protein [Thalassobaculales bacterium]
MTQVPPAIAACGDQLRAHDRERFLMSLFAPAAVRARLWAIYAFNDEVARLREQVREPLLGHIRLQWWRESLEGAAAGRPRRHPVVEGLALAIAEAGLPLAPFEAVLAAREQDLEPVPPADLAAFDAYAEGTGGAIEGLAALAMGLPEAAGRAAGRAYAMAGLLRAVPHHAARRRLHLPADRMAAHGVSARALLELRPEPGLRALVSELAGRVDATGSLPPAVLARGHLARLRRSGHDPFDARNALPLPLAPLRLWWASLGRRHG